MTRVEEAAPVAVWLQAIAAAHPDNPAIGDVNGRNVTYRELLVRVEALGDALRDAGIGVRDVVLIALTDGPTAFVAFLGVARVSVAFPMAAHEQPEEMERLIDESGAVAIVLEDRPASSLFRLAAAKNLTLITIHPRDDDAPGCFDVDITGPRLPTSAALPGCDDHCVLAATAGTSMEPKIVAWTHRSLHASITVFADRLQFNATDRALCMMPFMHLHSVVRTTLPVFVRGGHVVWAPGFDRARARGWLQDLSPTYTSAVPSIYRMLLDDLDRDGMPTLRTSLRRVGIGSDRVNQSLINRLERAFGVPVIQFYGMTETSPSIALTPASSAGMPPGAVGLVVSPPWSVRCVDQGTDVAPGAEGEIVVRGGIINPIVGVSGAHRQRIVDGWLHTGDIGRVDHGWLFVTGRLGDRITRGGRKIEPAAVEAALKLHAGVDDAVVFAIPDPILGQRVMAVVTARSGVTLDAGDVMASVARRLAHTMVPERIFIEPTIPTTNIGKVSRAWLAERFAPMCQGPVRPQVAAGERETTLEGEILDLLRAVLRRPTLGAHDDFFEAGGDSLLMMRALESIERRFGASIPPAAFRQHADSVNLARAIAGSTQVRSPRLVWVRETGSRPPLFVSHGVDGRNSFADRLGGALPADQPVCTFHATGCVPDALAPRDLEAIARDSVRLVRSAQPHGPYMLAGHSFGAKLAFVMARQLADAGERVSFLASIDGAADLDRRCAGLAHDRPRSTNAGVQNVWALRSAVLRPYVGSLVYFRATAETGALRSDPTSGWQFLTDCVTTVDIPGDHFSVVEGDGCATWADALDAQIRLAIERRQVDPTRATNGPACTARSLVLDALRAGKRGDLPSEIALYRSALARDPLLPFWVHGNLAEASFQSGDVDQGVQAYQRARRRDPWPMTTTVRMLPALRRHGRQALIAEAVDLASSITTDDPSVAWQQGQVFKSAGRPREAEAAFRHALRCSPVYLKAVVDLAEVVRDTGRIEEAVSLLSHAAERHPRRDFVHAALAWTQLEAKRSELAEAAARTALERSPTLAPFHALLSDILEAQGRFQEALAAAETAADFGGSRWQSAVDALRSRIAGREHERDATATIP